MTGLKSRIAISLDEDRPSYDEVYDAAGMLVVGLFLKSAFADEGERLNAFDDFCESARALLVKEIESGQGWKGDA